MVKEDIADIVDSVKVAVTAVIIAKTQLYPRPAGLK